ncbi:MAG: type II/IV secretion system ATPase subunit [Natronomonas sp.]
MSDSDTGTEDERSNREPDESQESSSDDESTDDPITSEGDETVSEESGDVDGSDEERFEELFEDGDGQDEDETGEHTGAIDAEERVANDRIDTEEQFEPEADSTPGETPENLDDEELEELVDAENIDAAAEILEAEQPLDYSPIDGDGADDESEIDRSPEETPDREAIEADVVSDVLAHFEQETEYPGQPDQSFIEEQFFDFSYLDRYEEVERQWVREPFAYVSVLYDPESNEHRYHVSEPILDDFEAYLREDLIGALRSDLLYADIEEKQDRETVFGRELRRVMKEHADASAAGTLQKLRYYLMRDFVRYGKIDPLVLDPNIEDISCDGSTVPIYVYHRRYRDLQTNLAFDADRLDSFVMRLAQRSDKHLSVSKPLLDASLPDGSRVQLTLGGEVTTRGSNFTIRRFTDVPFSPIDLINWGTFSLEQMAFLWLAIQNNRSAIFAGGTGSGKTTSINAVSMFIPPQSKIVSIEDTPEITLPHDNWIQSVTRDALAGDRGEINMYDLLGAALRQRPEYLIVGEIRAQPEVAFTFFQAIATGHTGYTTFHADTIPGLLSRLENEPLNIPLQLISNLDIVCIQQQVQVGDNRVRRNDSITEIIPERDGSIDTRDVFSWDPSTDTFEQSSRSYVLDSIAEERGWSDDRVWNEILVREEVLEYLLENDITDYRTVTGTIQAFTRDPDYLLERIRNDELGLSDLPTPGA